DHPVDGLELGGADGAREGSRRPAAASQAQRGVATRRHAIHADLVEGQQWLEARVRADGVDRAGYLGRTALPAFGADHAVVLEVVAPVLGHRDDEALLHQHAREIRVHPWRPARTVGDDDEPSIAAYARALPGHLEGEG